MGLPGHRRDGQRLLEGIDTTHLTLAETTTFASGIVVHTYVPQG